MAMAVATCGQCGAADRPLSPSLHLAPLEFCGVECRDRYICATGRYRPCAGAAAATHFLVPIQSAVADIMRRVPALLEDGHTSVADATEGVHLRVPRPLVGAIHAMLIGPQTGEKRPGDADDSDDDDDDAHRHKRAAHAASSSSSDPAAPLELVALPSDILGAIALHLDFRDLGHLAVTNRHMLAEMSDVTLLARMMALHYPQFAVLTDAMDRFVDHTSAIEPLDELPADHAQRPAARLADAMDEAFALRFYQVRRAQSGLYAMAVAAAAPVMNWRTFRAAINWRPPPPTTAAATASVPVAPPTTASATASALVAPPTTASATASAPVAPPPRVLELNLLDNTELNTLDVCPVAVFDDPGGEHTVKIDHANKILAALNAWTSPSDGARYRPVITRSEQQWSIAIPAPGDAGFRNVVQHVALGGQEFACKLALEIMADNSTMAPQRSVTMWIQALLGIRSTTLPAGLSLHELWLRANSLNRLTTWGRLSNIHATMFAGLVHASDAQIDLPSDYLRQLINLHTTSYLDAAAVRVQYQYMIVYMPAMLRHVTRRPGGAPLYYLDLTNQKVCIEVLNCITSIDLTGSLSYPIGYTRAAQDAIAALVEWRHPVTGAYAPLFSVIDIEREGGLRGSAGRNERISQLAIRLTRAHNATLTAGAPPLALNNPRRTMFLIEPNAVARLASVVPESIMLYELAVRQPPGTDPVRVQDWLQANPKQFVEFCFKLPNHFASRSHLYSWFSGHGIAMQRSCIEAIVDAIPMIAFVSDDYDNEFVAEANFLGVGDPDDCVATSIAVAAHFLGELNALRVANGEAPTDYTADQWLQIRGAAPP